MRNVKRCDAFYCAAEASCYPTRSAQEWFVPYLTVSAKAMRDLADSRDRETMARPQIRISAESRSVIVRQTLRGEKVARSYEGEGEGAEGYQGS